MIAYTYIVLKEHHCLQVNYIASYIARKIESCPEVIIVIIELKHELIAKVQ